MKKTFLLQMSCYSLKDLMDEEVITLDKRDLIENVSTIVFIISLILIFLSILFLTFKLLIPIMKIVFIVSTIVATFMGVLLPCILEELD